MFIQIGFEDVLEVSAVGSFEDLLGGLNDLLGENTYLIENNGKKIDLSSDYQLIEDETYKIWPKVLGGKGGFGSLLRSFGKQILISKNKEACRDLNGRRMRDVNNEKKLKEWMQKQLEKSATSSSSSDNKNKPSSSSSEDKTDYRNVPPPHKFSDAAYDEQKKQITEDINDSVKIAAEFLQTKKKKSSPTAVSTNDDDKEVVTTKKRRHSDDTLEDGELHSKKTKSTKGANAAFFVGIDLDDLSSDEEEEASDAKKKKLVNH